MNAAQQLDNALNQAQLSRKDIVNPDDVHYTQHAYRVDCTFGCIGVVFADCAQDALDELADNGNLEAYKVLDHDADNYSEGELDYLGNYSDRYLINELHINRLT